MDGSSEDSDDETLLLVRPTKPEEVQHELEPEEVRLEREPEALPHLSSRESDMAESDTEQDLPHGTF